MSQTLPNGAPILSQVCTPKGISWPRWLASILSAVFGLQLGLQSAILGGSVSGSVTDEAGNVLTVKRAHASVAASTTGSVLVTAVAAKKIRILSLYALTGETATTSQFLSNTTALSEAFALPISGNLNLGYNPAGHFETAAGEGFKVTTGAGATTVYQYSYVEVA